MKIKKISQKIFKTFFQKIFIFLHGKIKETHNLDHLEVKKITVNNIKSDINPEKDYKIYEIKNGRIYTDTIQNVAIIKNNFLIPDISFQQVEGELKTINFNSVLRQGTPRLKKKFNGTVLSLVQGASGNNYFHFLFDIIPRLNLCEEIYSLDKIDFFYVPGTFEWQKKILKTFGIREDKLINSKIFRHIVANKIIAVDHPWYHKGIFQDELKNIPSWIVFWLRDKFLSMALKFENSKKIFIDRSDSKYKHCQLQSNNEIINFLKKKGFKSYRLSELDFFEQIYLFKNAEFIIGPHGAFVTNLIFCEPNTKVIEIIPESHQNMTTSRLSHILKLNHKRITTPELAEKDKKFGDILFSAEDMNNILIKDFNFQ